jgi:hypothetical protein
MIGLLIRMWEKFSIQVKNNLLNISLIVFTIITTGLYLSRNYGISLKKNDIIKSYNISQTLMLTLQNIEIYLKFN